jgi:uncharacterized NAD-dependent epimerase/dehydratase family protein
LASAHSARGIGTIRTGPGPDGQDSHKKFGIVEPVVSSQRRICILTDGRLDPFTAKTAVGLLRYCPDEVVAVIDREHAGGSLVELLGCGDGVPVVRDIESAMAFHPDQLVLGVAVPGGRVPDEWRSIIRAALLAGLDVVNGLHTRLRADAELADIACQAGRRIVDIRDVAQPSSVGTGQARTTSAHRVLTVGTDCNIGKRLTALELSLELRRRKRRAEFVATGQTGVLITGSGVVVDAVVSDFVSGAVEQAILDRADADYVVVEGQGALLHPSYSAVTLGLLHGALPDSMVLCHASARTTLRNTDVPMPSLDRTIELYESVVEPIHPARIVGVALNGLGLNDAEQDRAIEEVRRQTGLPVVDPVRTGVGDLVDAIESRTTS